MERERDWDIKATGEGGQIEDRKTDRNS